MNDKLIKSRDTEEWIDRLYTRPVAQLMVPLLARWGVHPNAVTLASWAVGMVAGVCFYFGPLTSPNWLCINLCGVVLLAVANFMDSADGQLARLTGKCSPLGRILDGASGDVWYFVIYWALYLRTIPMLVPSWGWPLAVGVPFVLGCFDGFVVHVHQCRLADYYRNIHLWVLGGRSELDTYAEQKAKYDALSWRRQPIESFFQWLYVNYTRAQEADTPQFQRMRSLLAGRYGGDVPGEFRDRFRRRSFRILWCTNAMVFNQRALALYVFCLLDLPWMVFFFEVGYLGAVYLYMHWYHERMCRQFADEL